MCEPLLAVQVRKVGSGLATLGNTKQQEERDKASGKKKVSTRCLISLPGAGMGTAAGDWLGHGITDRADQRAICSPWQAALACQRACSRGAEQGMCSWRCLILSLLVRIGSTRHVAGPVGRSSGCWHRYRSGIMSLLSPRSRPSRDLGKLTPHRPRPSPNSLLPRLSATPTILKHTTTSLTTMTLCRDFCPHWESGARRSSASASRRAVAIISSTSS